MLRHRLSCPGGGKITVRLDSSWLCTLRKTRPVGREQAARRRRSGRPSLARFPLCVALSGGFLRVGYYVDPLRVRRGRGVVVIVPVPPLVRRGLGVTLWRVLPSLLTAERRDVEVAPEGPHRLVAAVVDEVCTENLVAIAEEDVVAVPFIDAEVLIETVGDRVP